MSLYQAMASIRRGTYGVFGPDQPLPVNGYPFVLAPSGGADDSALMSAAFATYDWVVAAQGSIFQVANPIAVPLDSPRLKVFEGRGSKIVSSMTPTGGPGGYLKSVFLGLSSPVGAATTLAANATIGSRQVILSAPLAAGARIEIAQPTNNIAQQFTIRSIVGNVAQLSKPVLYGFQAGDVVSEVKQPKNIRIDGWLIDGTGDRAVEIGLGLNCAITGIRTPSTSQFQSILVSADIGSEDMLISDCLLDGGGTAAACVALESNVNGVIDRCDLSWAGGGVGCGIYVPDGRNVTVRDSTSSSCLRGVYITEGGSGAQNGSASVRLRGVSVDTTTNEGILVTGSVDGLTFEGVDVRKSGTYGIAVTSGVGQPINVQWSNVTVSGAGTHSIYLQGTRLGFVNLTTDSAAAGFGLDIGDDVNVSGKNWRINTPCSTGALNLDVGGGLGSRITIDDVDIAVGAHTGVQIAQAGPGCALEFSNVKVALGVGAGAWVDWQAGTGSLRESNIVTTDGNYAVYMAHGALCTLFDGPGVDFSSIPAGNRYVIDATARSNKGTGQADGAGTLVVSMPALQTGQVPTINQTSAATLPHQVTLTPGTGFQIQGDPNAMYSWEVQ